MRYATVCSGIEAPSVAWHPLGWKPVFFSEIEAFPSCVLEQRWPGVPNLGDMTRFREWPDAALDLLCAGTPCQSFSVAGLRKGLDDPRGNLMLTYLATAARFSPRWLVWENVPGVLSIDGGRAFGTLLGGLGQLGYGFAHRVLDAQFFGVPQRRRRVFVVGCLGDWRAAAAVLFERHSLSGHPAPSREAGERIARPIAAGSASSGGYRNDADTADNIIAGTLQASGKAAGSATQQDAESDLLVTHSLRADGFDASEDGTGRGTPLAPVSFDWQAGGGGNDQSFRGKSRSYIVDKPGTCRSITANKTMAIAFDTTQITHPENRSNPKPGGPAPSLAKGGHAPAVAFDARQSDVIQYGDRTGPLDTDGHMMAIRQAMQVRRLTPRECERLQGFPDDYTLVTYRGKPAADGPRYKALGNSMAVPVVRWIGERIAQVDHPVSPNLITGEP